jgi:hypothetical protein
MIDSGTKAARTHVADVLGEVREAFKLQNPLLAFSRLSDSSV